MGCDCCEFVKLILSVAKLKECNLNTVCMLKGGVQVGVAWEE